MCLVIAYDVFLSALSSLFLKISLSGKNRASCFTLFVFMLLCWCLCFVCFSRCRGSLCSLKFRYFLVIHTCVKGKVEMNKDFLIYRLDMKIHLI